MWRASVRIRKNSKIKIPSFIKRTSLAFIVLAVAGLFGTLQFATAYGTENVIVTTDKPDYAPMEMVTITGSGFDPGRTFNLQIVSSDIPPVELNTDVVADAGGKFVYKYQLDGNYRPNYTVYVKDGLTVIAQTSFTDANPATDISQCQNGGIGDPLQPCSETAPFAAASGYGYEGNANANGSNSHWFEGDFVPLRIVATNYVAGAGYIDFSIDVTKGNKHAYDYIGSFDATETTGASNSINANHNNPVTDIIAGASPTSPDSTGNIPAAILNPFPAACASNTFTGTQAAGAIKAWGTDGPLTVTYPSQNVGSSDCVTTVRVAWTGTKAGFGGTIVIAYAAHIAKQADWGTGNSAISISGSPYHSSLVARNTGGETKVIGNQDAKLAASAVIVPQNATLTLVKTVTNDNGGSAAATAWTLSASGPTPISGTTSSPAVTNAVVTQGTYNLSESGGPSGYTAGTYSCVKNGGAPVPGNSITLAANDVATCTINNNDNAPALHLRKTVTNDNGGNAAVTAWTLSATGTGGSPTNLSGTTPVDSNSSFKADTYALAEAGGPSGYTAGAWDCGAAAMPDATHVTVPLGANVTCTINNDDQQAYITVVKVVTNDNGGSADPDDFNLKLEGNAVTSGVAVPVNPGIYTASEILLDGYTFEGFTGDCDSNGDVTVALGQSKTCTLTNNDQQAYIIVDKTVVNNNGGSAQPNDFLLTVNGNAVSDEVAYPVNPGTYTAGETQLPGYTAGAWGGDCDANAQVTVALGQTKTCTITNDDEQAYITVTKVVNKNHGGTAQPNDFSLKLEGNAVSSGVAVPVNPGTYTATETLLDGYTFDGYTGDCDSNGDVTVALGQSKTCTLTNSDIAPQLTVIKHVVNNNGGSAVAGGFTMNVTATDPSDDSFPGDEAGTTITLRAGSYGADENSVAGYTKTLSADCSGTIAVGEHKTCTITNDDQQAYITVTKVVDNDFGGTAQPNDFSLKLEGNAVLSGVAVPVNPGTYTASETLAAGYEFDGFSGDCDASGDVTVALGENKSCTLTNSDIQPKLIVIKHVINDNGGTSVADNFTMMVSGTNASPSFFGGDEAGTNVGLDAGSYSVGEIGVTNYTASFSTDCTGSIAVGETKTCTITNNDNAPVLHLRKEIVNDNGGSAAATAWTLTANGTDANDVTGTTPVDSEASLQADTFALSETNGPSGYTASDWVCVGGTQNGANITLGIGDEATCTITNDDIAPQLTVIKHVINDDGDIAAASDFTMHLTGTNLSNNDFAGSESGVTVTLNAGAYTVDETDSNGYVKTLSADCSGTIAVGETKTCTITNNDIPHATRTQGFWQTHTNYTTSIFASSSWTIGSKVIDTPGELFAGFYASVSKTTSGAKRSQLDQARMQMLQQWLAAKLNCKAFGCSAGTQTLLNNAAAAWSTTNRNLILSYASQLDAYNNSNDALPISGQGKATPKVSQTLATFQIAYFNTLP